MFRDRTTGDVVIIQPLNWPLGIYFAFALVRWVTRPEGAVGTAVDVVAFTALMWWAVDEVLRGVNPFRRILGAVVAVATVVGVLV